jgi:hypothetical protein
MAEVTTTPEKSGNWFSDLWGGLTGTIGDVANSSTAQKLLDAGASYAEAKLAADAAKDKAAADRAAKAGASTLPSWVIPVGVGSAVLLVLALLLKGRRK